MMPASVMGASMMGSGLAEAIGPYTTLLNTQNDTVVRTINVILWCCGGGNR